MTSAALCRGRSREKKFMRPQTSRARWGSHYAQSLSPVADCSSRLSLSLEEGNCCSRSPEQEQAESGLSSAGHWALVGKLKQLQVPEGFPKRF